MKTAYLLLLTGAVVGGVLLLSRSAAPAPAPGPAPGPNPLPPALQQAFDDLMAKAQQDPAAVDPNQMDATADQIDAAGFREQAAQLHAAADAVRRAHQLPPIPNPQGPGGFGTTPFTTTGPGANLPAAGPFVPIPGTSPPGAPHIRIPGAPPNVPVQQIPPPVAHSVPARRPSGGGHAGPSMGVPPPAPTFSNPQGLSPSELLRRMHLGPFRSI